MPSVKKNYYQDMNSKKQTINNFLESHFNDIRKDQDPKTGKVHWFLKGKPVAGYQIKQKVYYFANHLKKKISQIISLSNDEAEDLIISWFLKKFDLVNTDLFISYDIPYMDR